jgi:hypothetical protein
MKWFIDLLTILREEFPHKTARPGITVNDDGILQVSFLYKKLWYTFYLDETDLLMEPRERANSMIESIVYDQ